VFWFPDIKYLLMNMGRKAVDGYLAGHVRRFE